MSVDYTLPKPTAGSSRATSPTESEIMADIADTIADVGSRLDAVEGGASQAGILSARPAASASNAGAFYLATDENGGTLYRSNGSSWVQVASSVDLTGDYRADDEPIVLGATSGHVITGTPSASNRNGFDAWHYDPASDESVGFAVLLPASWATYNLVIEWTNAGAGSGNVVWRYDRKEVGSGDSAAVSSTQETPVTATAPTSGVMSSTTLGSGIAVPAAGDYLSIQIPRLAVNAADTLANDAALWFVKLSKAS